MNKQRRRSLDKYANHNYVTSNDKKREFINNNNLTKKTWLQKIPWGSSDQGYRFHTLIESKQ